MSATILVVDDEDTARMAISSYFRSRSYEVIDVGTLAEARSHMQQGVADIIILDVSLPDGYGPNLLYEAAQMPLRPQIILITAYGEIEQAVDAMKNGAQDFMLKPLEFGELETSIQRAEEIISMRRELNHLRHSHKNQDQFIIGKTNQMKSLVNLAQRAADTSVSVLITGETGTGKEILANFIHQVGPRADKPFIAINCAAIQNTMLESELFGYEAGAFTGAVKRKNGLLEVADGGVLFLDEISSMPYDMQAKLLRAIEERGFRRVGGTTMIKIDVQVIAASNRNLQDMIDAGKFREDLYYRLKVVDLHLPALRDRKEDIPDLVGMILRKSNAIMGMNIQDVTANALKALIDYNWPGNIRELKNTVERSMLFCMEPAIDINHLPADILAKKA